mmetsp:Transcript_37496/g.112443  ORF Transcript_37496/g.112443 Transcript_37496/m.112443 type:complete len:218 (+) Transcript_37496:610-1263(+)
MHKFELLVSLDVTSRHGPMNQEQIHVSPAVHFGQAPLHALPNLGPPRLLRIVPDLGADEKIFPGQSAPLHRPPHRGLVAVEGRRVEVPVPLPNGAQDHFLALIERDLVQSERELGDFATVVHLEHRLVLEMRGRRHVSGMFLEGAATCCTEYRINRRCTSHSKGNLFQTRKLFLRVVEDFLPRVFLRINAADGSSASFVWVHGLVPFAGLVPWYCSC